MPDREIVDHVVDAGANEHTSETVRILVLDEEGPGGASHHYAFFDAQGDAGLLGQVMFQRGPVKVEGINGITNEALLATVVDRLRSFQRGPYACRDNAIALTHIETALLFLQKRTRERMRRGVEGKNEA